ncbi:unnamed protein product [Parnassius apollo]|uniref:(apollo) hypothetical protein n=1 Tax=Parnassius apollo TaxID=110799 RepID=A0A8S3XGW9_PARAO|nr:unnamed protein product [Parnassius apollo]
MLGRNDAGRSIQGFFASGANNPVFATAVARALVGRVDVTRLSRKLGCVQAEALVAVVALWAARDSPGLTVSVEGEDERPATREEEQCRLNRLVGMPAEEAAAEVERSDAPGGRLGLTVTALIANKPLASRAVVSRVCLLCLASHLCCEEGELGAGGSEGAGEFTFEEVRCAIVSRGGQECARTSSGCRHPQQRDACGQWKHSLCHRS